ncbi:MAG: NrdH-redoxin [Chloroflexi bacterium]|nr:NrdH-redoxin [Chloroflexota bacterium]|tara:strand:- start:6548 stop:6808 length:261 start_codon:yes stop_codon:yes gene_type:complete
MNIEKETTINNDTIVYTHPTCGYCDLLKEDLIEKKIDFIEIDVSINPEEWTEVEKLSGGDRITPVMIKADGSVEIGYKGIGCNYNY